MSEPKPLASLSGSLLARKGAARPAMRPQMQHFPRIETQAAVALEDLGWNDMGEPEEPRHVADILPLTPAPKSPEAVAETEQDDRKAAEQLAENARQIAETGALEPPARPEVVLQQEALSVRIQEAMPRKANRIARRSALAEGRRAAFTLRLDAERHLQLRLASTIHGRSAQQIVTEALDALLDTIPELNTLAAQVKRR
jgi:hypothetical protein